MLLVNFTETKNKMKLQNSGSLINWIMAGSKEEPVVGKGCTLLYFSDRYPGTIIDVRKTPKKIVIQVQEDHAKRIDNNGMSENQEYEYSIDPNGRISKFTFYKSTWKSSDGPSGICIGERDRYYDFSF